MITDAMAVAGSKKNVRGACPVGGARDIAANAISHTSTRTKKPGQPRFRESRQLLANFFPLKLQYA